MAMENGKDFYEELDAKISHETVVDDVTKFIESMLRFFSGKGILYISSYDFGYWADRLSGFRSADRVKLKTSWQSGAFLENGFTITDEFIYVFMIECVKNIDARRVFNQFLIYDKGSPLLQCCGNFEDVFVNAKVPKSLVKTMTENNAIKSWA
jgi:hypothetical protein